VADGASVAQDGPRADAARPADAPVADAARPADARLIPDGLNLPDGFLPGFCQDNTQCGAGTCCWGAPIAGTVCIPGQDVFGVCVPRTSEDGGAGP
jgi:hypothetical protein